mmetsp:Transcript_41643/g.114886  ORF Transcript_41643/g.114886 Transcript_41643/m.114886 type:complete len:264 (-) Transcript_41643:11-802(-)
MHCPMLLPSSDKGFFHASSGKVRSSRSLAKDPDDIHALAIQTPMRIEEHATATSPPTASTSCLNASPKKVTATITRGSHVEEALDRKAPALCWAKKCPRHIMMYEAAREPQNISRGPIPAKPPATPPAKLLRVIGAANFHAPPVAARSASGLVSSFLKLSTSDKPSHAKIAKHKRDAISGPCAPRIMPTSEENRAPRALKKATIPLRFLLSGVPCTPNEAPTAKLSMAAVSERTKHSNTVCMRVPSEGRMAMFGGGSTARAQQ